MIVYLDVVFGLNFLLDGVLLFLTGYLAGVPRRWKRLLLGSVAGGLYAAPVFLPELFWLAWLPVRLAWGIFLILLAYGCSCRFGKLCFLFYALSCVLAGITLAAGATGGQMLYQRGAYLFPISISTLLFSTAICFLLLWLLGYGSAKLLWEQDKIVTAEFELFGTTVHLRALRDSGNTLCDPLYGDAVLVVQSGELRSVWPPEIEPLLSGRADARTQLLQLEKTKYASAFYLLPYRSIGENGGLLLAVRAHSAKIGALYMNMLPVALSSGKLSGRKEYEALWGGPIR